jgi:hypothetical protein
VGFVGERSPGKWSHNTRPISDPHKEIPTKTHSNPMNNNPPKIPLKIPEKEKRRSKGFGTRLR